MHGDSVIAAGIDLAFARDSSALVIAARKLDTVRVLEMEEVRGGAASDPVLVMMAFAKALERHGIKRAMADVHYRELLAVELGARGIELVPAPARPVESYLHARREMAAGRVQVPPHTLRRRLIQQLRDTQGKPLPSGGMSITHGRKGGGHGDIASALVLAVWQLRDDDDAEVLRVGSRMAPVMGRSGGEWCETPDDAEIRDEVEDELARSRTSERWGELPDRGLDIW